MSQDKRVLICASVVPFVFGGAELHVRSLERAVSEAGYGVDVVSVPYRWSSPERIIKSCLVWRLLELQDCPDGEIDLVVATKFPTYAVEHSNKVAWVFHQQRSLYDLKGTMYDDFSIYENAEEYRDVIQRMDRRFLSECREVFATSRNVAGRLRDHCGISSDVVYHPPPLDGSYYSDDYGDDVLVVGRLEPLKRVDLAIEAMKYVKNKRASLRVIGRGFLESALKEHAKKVGVADKVKFEGFVSERDLLSFYAHAGCVLYVPFDEDYGYVTLEAFMSRRPVIVTEDSGGPLEFVSDGESGRVVPTGPRDLAGAIDEMLGDRSKARRFGAAGFESVQGISWGGVIDTLISPFVG